ncbi:MAG: neutral zinc metallopeptidase [Kiritimatiellae bacterium]|nr:neutral zinc metallopeptidase [Kiritimatiellia bacterium]
MTRAGISTAGRTTARCRRWATTTPTPSWPTPAATRCAEVIGDDYLQKKARGTVLPETFTHGKSSSRMKWFKQGLQTGRLDAGVTFSVPFDSL